MRTVLVTGGAGFIGSHLSQALLEHGYHVRIIDNLSYGKKEWIPKHAEFIKGDIRDLEFCHRVMNNIEGVFHCAAMSRSAPSSDNIELCTQVNILGTQNILLAARNANIKKIIYSGSATYYGNQSPPHYEYQAPAQSLNFYALSKHVGEQYCLLFDKLFDVPCIILRYFSVYGPRQPQTGAYALVMGIFLQCKANNTPLPIHGDGSQCRDFIHVNDVVDANIIAFESNLRHEIFNIGSGKATSIQELADYISEKQYYTNKRVNDAEITLADISRAQILLQWQPKISLKPGLIALMENKDAYLCY